MSSTFVTVEDAANQLGVSNSYVYWLIRVGRIPAQKSWGIYAIDARGLEDFKRGWRRKKAQK